MTTDATIEEQITAAEREFRATRGHGGCDHLWTVQEAAALHRVMRDLLAGKFKDEPLPEIVPPPWPHKNLRVHAIHGGWQVECEGAQWFSEFHGPNVLHKREAVLAWNAVFSRSDER